MFTLLVIVPYFFGYFTTEQVVLTSTTIFAKTKPSINVEINDQNMEIIIPATIENATQAPRPPQLRIHISGEPTSYERVSEDGKKCDLLLLAGGANAEPERAFWFGELVSVFGDISNPKPAFVPMKDRNFADVMYRSSHCAKEREDAVAIVRKHVEEAGFVFKTTGKCGGTGYPVNEIDPSQRGSWLKCEVECPKSKIILAFERATPGLDYLGEKLFLPLYYGAIPAYRGNGHRLMDKLTLNRKSFIDRNSFASDEEFAKGIVALLKDEKRLEEIQREPIYENYPVAAARMNFWNDPERYAEKGIPEILKFIKNSPRFRPFLNRDVIYYWTPREDHNVEKVVKVLLNARNVVKLPNARANEADVEVDRCC